MNAKEFRNSRGVQPQSQQSTRLKLSTETFA